MSPLFRDADVAQPNILPGLLELMGGAYRKGITPEDFAAYLFGIMAHPGYTAHFYEELDTREIRVPITKDAGLFESVRSAGARLIWLQTYGQRYVPGGEPKGQVPTGAAKNTVSVPQTEECFPISFSYDEGTQTLHVGKGQFAPVAVSPRTAAMMVTHDPMMSRHRVLNRLLISLNRPLISPRREFI